MHQILLPNGQSCRFRVRQSRKARSPRLKISRHAGLEVVVPWSLAITDEQLRHAVAGKAHWVMRHLWRLADTGGQRGQESHPLPSRIDLAALRECWRLEYIPGPGQAITLREVEGPGLQVHGDIAHRADGLRALRGWVQARARRVLPPWLEHLAQGMGMAYGRVSIRNQRTRWGSCSGSNAINLNCQLLFLPRICVRYVLCHELCHTQVRNHGPAFWTLLLRHEPRARIIRQELSAASRQIPAWMVR